MQKISIELKQLRKLKPLGFNSDVICLKEKDIDALSILLFSDASFEYITSNLLSKRKFNILLKYSVFDIKISNNNRVTYIIGSEYQNQVRDIYIKYYRMKFSK